MAVYEFWENEWIHLVCRVRKRMYNSVSTDTLMEYWFILWIIFTKKCQKNYPEPLPTASHIVLFWNLFHKESEQQVSARNVPKQENTINGSMEKKPGATRRILVHNNHFWVRCMGEVWDKLKTENNPKPILALLTVMFATANRMIPIGWVVGNGYQLSYGGWVGRQNRCEWLLDPTTFWLFVSFWSHFRPR